jgi:hypothetical protein
MEIFYSDKPKKRFVAVINGKKIYFGQPDANTYIDGADDTTRDNYRKRHYANKTEKYRIDNLIPSPSLLSWYILWGDSHSICKNIKYLNRLIQG